MNVLVLCTGNSARSILAEAIFNATADGRVRAYSAGSNPTGQINPAAISLLERKGYATGDLRSKSWNEFATDGAPEMDLVITVCSSAAAETCPVWPGAPLSAHWPVEDPASALPAEAALAFEQAFQRLHRTINRFLELPFEQMDGAALASALRDIGDGA